MKVKTIKQVLKKKFNDFVSSIDDDKVRKLVKKNSIITGGSIASMLMGEKVNDYDIYFKNKETVLAVCDYYINKFITNKEKDHKRCPVFSVLDYTTDTPTYTIKNNDIDENREQEIRNDFNRILNNGCDVFSGRIIVRVISDGVAYEDNFEFDENPNESVDIDEDFENTTTDTELVEKSKYRPVYISTNAITLSNNVQLIIRFFGDADEIHENYDFEHCTCYWESDSNNLTLPEPALECLLTKELRYRGSKYPLASIIRARKFLLRGFSINAGQYLKMCIQLNDLELRNRYVLEDQLMGVDALYFSDMIRNIPKDKFIDDMVDASYLLEMINKFF